MGYDVAGMARAGSIARHYTTLVLFDQCVNYCLGVFSLEPVDRSAHSRRLCPRQPEIQSNQQNSRLSILTPCPP